MSNHKQPEIVIIDDIEVKVITLKAVLIKVDDEEHWIPRSQIHTNDIRKTDTSIEITPWIAKQKGLR